MKWLRFVIILLAPLALSACLEALEPLIGPETAIAPLEPGYFELCNRSYAGPPISCHPVQLELRPDRQYSAISVNGTEQLFAFGAGAEGHRDIVQLTENGHLGYGFSAREGDLRIAVFPECDDMPPNLKKEIRDKGGLLPETIWKGRCFFSSIEALRAYTAVAEADVPRAPGMLKGAKMSSFQALGAEGHDRFAKAARGDFEAAIAGERFGAAIEIAALQFRRPVNAQLRSELIVAVRSAMPHIVEWARSRPDKDRHDAMLTVAWARLITGEPPDLSSLAWAGGSELDKEAAAPLVIAASTLALFGADRFEVCRTIGKIRILQPDMAWALQDWLRLAGQEARCAS